MRRALLALPLLIAGCAQGPSLSERLGAWVGRSEGDLVAEFGVPVRTHEADGRRFLQFEQRRNIAVPAPGFDTPYFSPWGPRFGQWNTGLAYTVVGCDVTFALRQGRVESFTYRGDGCG